MKFVVPIVYRGLVNYVVEAESKERAEDIARHMWGDGEPAPMLGNEWEEIDVLGEIEEVTE